MEAPRRKPLLIRGARQVGKTWLAKEFGRRHFRNVVYVNFDLDANPAGDRRIHAVFEQDIRPDRLVRALEALFDTSIEPGETLIILDEVQEQTRAMAALKYFAEDAPGYHVVAAGSHLGVAMRPGTGLPVGKVDVLSLFPLTFTEFLAALRRDRLAEAVAGGEWDLLAVLHGELTGLLREYLCVGGMPEVVQGYAENGSLVEARATQDALLQLLRADFSKHAPASQLARVWQVWDSIPVHLAKENQRLVWGAVRPGARARDLELAFQWLIDYGVVYKLPRLTRPGLPLAAYVEDAAFKAFGLDVGLLGAMAKLDVATLMLGEAAFTEFRGTLAEQFVHQHLVAALGADGPLAYWTGKAAEVDFVAQLGGMVVPLEVKSATQVRSKSLRSYLDRYHPAQAFRLSLAPHEVQTGFTNVPLYAVETIPREAAA
ncbi:MAG: AAA family ATPase [Propionibacteriaceae bacterium]|nr:AAA family ATPase [Propionibacteriaceae bacterium]